MLILVDDAAETVSPAYGEAFDLVGVKGLGSGSQGCCGGEGSPQDRELMAQGKDLDVLLAVGHA